MVLYMLLQPVRVAQGVVESNTSTTLCIQLRLLYSEFHGSGQHRKSVLPRFS